MNREQILQRVRKGVAKGLDELAIRFQREMRLELSKPGKGKLYRRGKGKKAGRNKRERGIHRASAPGQPPAVDTGTLRRSWQAGSPDSKIDRSRVNDPSKPTIRIGTKVKYAPYLEYGTRRMAARPSVQRPLNRVRAEATRIVAAQIARALRAK